jgi:hypothetical protein
MNDRTGRKTTRTGHGWWWLWFLCAVGLAAGCPNRHRPIQGVRIRCSDHLARVFIDGRFVGLNRKLKGRVVYLKKGLHLIEIRKRGKFARYRQVHVRHGQVEELRIRLYRELE